MDGTRFWRRLFFERPRSRWRSRARWLGLISALFGAAGGLVTAQTRALSFYNTHTREHLTVIYRRGNEYVSAALTQINHILRDPLNGAEHLIDPGLLDFLYDLVQKIGYHRDVHIVCGYRTPQTNTWLHSLGRGVSLRSLHMLGMALDFRLPGISTKTLWEAAVSMKRGGAGYYRESDFVQIDTGRVRSW